MIKITQLSQLNFSKSYNYANYLTWQLDEMVELSGLDKYQLKAMFTDDDVATPALFPDLKLDLTQVFESFD